MINAFGSHNYKCLHTDMIKLYPLTLLSGGNNVGKTTYIKALLDLARKNDVDTILSNLPLISNYKSKVFNHKEENNISFNVEFKYEKSSVDFSTTFSYNENAKGAFQSYIKILLTTGKGTSTLEMFKDEPESPYSIKADRIFSIMYATVKDPDKLPSIFEAIGDFEFIGYIPYIGKFSYRENPEFSKWFEFENENDYVQLKLEVSPLIFDSLSTIHYIGPVRSSPQEYYFLETRNLTMDSSGKNTIEIIDRLQNKRIKYYKNLNDETLTDESLLKAVQFWFRYFFGNVTFELLPHTETLIQVLINGHAINHSGFGFSQLLPIIVESLLLKREHTLVLEQPELHLHPELERKLAYFLLCITKNNRQIIAETHSEHMVNELVIQKMHNNKLSEKFQVYFLTQQTEKTNFESIKISDRGEIENWPEGFFDQYLNFSKELIEKRREIALKKIAEQKEH